MKDAETQEETIYLEVAGRSMDVHIAVPPGPGPHPGVLLMFHSTDWPIGLRYVMAIVVTGIVHLFFSVAFPSAIARHAAEPTIATFVRFLHGVDVLSVPSPYRIG